MTLVDPKQKKPEPKKESPLPKIELGEEATVEDLAAAMNNVLQQLDSRMAEKLSSVDASMEKKISDGEATRVAGEVDKFKVGKKDFDEMLSDINSFYMAGKTLEESYNLARVLHGKSPVGVNGDEGTPETPDEPKDKKPPVSSIKSSGVVDGTEAGTTDLRKLAQNQKNEVVKAIDKNLEKAGISEGEMFSG